MQLYCSKLFSLGLQSYGTIHMVLGFPQTDPAPAPITTHAANNTPAVTRGVGSNDGLFPGFGSNALVRGGAPGLFGTGLPELDQMQQQLTQNPDMIREIMNMPAVKNLMNNPELRHGLITRNLQMHELMYWNPEVAHILNDANIGSCKKPQTHA
ncbi:hypothetical protein SAY86_001367 [Trapa natans]|uniref:STI1 domain-containing protein n=1 Tax=Trapa natans TaxID=22666 RepID=A0AAN7REL5_TRANT|nr:hypothetical protein SAY86_001367 [Trapa natans]